MGTIPADEEEVEREQCHLTPPSQQPARDLGQVPAPLWASVSPSGNEDTCSSRLIMRVTHASGPEPGVEKWQLSSPD